MNPPEKSLSVLVIDDEAQIQRLLTVALQAHGYRVLTAADGKQGLVAATQRPDVVILDLGLPDMNGIQVLRKIREWSQAPVIVLTVEDGEVDKVESLDSGADDYVTKPFNTAELLARLRATVRRAHNGHDGGPVHRFGDVEVDLTGRKVTRKGQPVKLTATEYILLRLFVQNAGRVLTHQHILRTVWGAGYETHTQYLRVYMARLREKLEEDNAGPVMFFTLPGVGYRLAESFTSA